MNNCIYITLGYKFFLGIRLSDFDSIFLHKTLDSAMDNKKFLDNFLTKEKFKESSKTEENFGSEKDINHTYIYSKYGGLFKYSINISYTVIN